MHRIKQYLPMKAKSQQSDYLLYCNYYSFYSQKVIMALHEKNIPFDPFVIDITKGEQYSSWFLEINPRGEIPVLKAEDVIIPDSIRIIDHFENFLNSDGAPLIEVTSDGKVVKNIEKFRNLFEALPAGIITVGSFFHPDLCGTPKFPFILPVRDILKNGDLSNADNLRKLAETHPKAKKVLLYKADIQDRKREIVTNREEYLKVLRIVDQVLTEVEEQLVYHQNEGDWLCSTSFTIADINLAILLQRLWELGLEDRFWTNGKRPLTENYFNRVRERDSFKKTIPNIGDHLKLIVTVPPPAFVGAAGAATLGVVLAIMYAFKKIFTY